MTELPEPSQGISAGGQLRAPGQPRTVQWNCAIPLSLMVAVVVGALSALLGFGVVFWVLCGSMTSVGLYRRRMPRAWLDTRGGMRIGLLTGVLAVAVAMLVFAGSLLLQRFLFHGTLLEAMFLSFQQQIPSTIAAANATGDQAARIEASLRYLLSPEGRAGVVLGGIAILDVLILVLSAAGGAIGAKLFQKQRQDSAII